MYKKMNCPACSKTEISQIGNSGKYVLNICDSCKVEFWTPLEHPGETFYETSHLHDIEGERSLQWRHHEFLKNPPTKGRLLDVGCGPAEFLYYCRNIGFDVFGIDIAPRNIEEAKQRYGIHVFCGTLSDYISAHPEERFDVITFFEIVEHLADPKSFFADVRKLLKPGGTIVMSVPNVDRFGGPKEKEETPPNHLFRWREKALRKFLEKEGYGDICIKLQPFSYEFFLVRGWFSFGIGKKTDPRSALSREETKRLIEMQQGWRTKTIQVLARIKNKTVKPLSMLMALPIRILGFKYWDMYATAKIK